MKTKIFYINLFLFFSITIFSQEKVDWKKIATLDLKLIESNFDNTKKKLDEQKKKLEEKREKYDTEGLVELTDDVKALNNNLVKYCDSVNYLKTYYVAKNVPKKFLDSLFSNEKCIYSTLPSDEKRYKKFVIAGDHEPVPYDSLFTSNKYINQVMMDVFSKESHVNLGTFEIPSEKTKIVMYKVPDSAFFKSIDFEIQEGSIVDVRVVLENKETKMLYYFENTSPYSLLRYSRFAGLNKLRLAYRKSTSNIDNGSKSFYYSNDSKRLKQIDRPYINLIDVLNYYPFAGNNYVPENGHYHWPHDAEQKNEWEKANYTYLYQIQNDNSFQNIADIRAYTDFASVFGNQPNGVVQVEAKADFFINPFNSKQSNSYFFKKIIPFIRYSRLDKQESSINLEGVSNPTETLNNNVLLLSQKAKLNFGLELDLWTFKIRKEQPFETTLYFTTYQNSTPITVKKDSLQFNFNTLNYGGGIKFSVKRYQNFGFNFGLNLVKQSNLGNYEEYNIGKPKEIYTTTGFAESFYYPDKNKNQSVFLRLLSTRTAFSKDYSYYQLQFGYRFTFGINKVTSNN